MARPIDVRDTRDGVSFAIKARPGAGKNCVSYANKILTVEVKAQPENGKANEAVIKTIASELGLKGYDIRIAAGTTSRKKQIRIDGLSKAQFDKIMVKFKNSRKPAESKEPAQDSE